MRGANTRARWVECAELATNLGVTKQQVHNFLYGRMKDEGWIAPILDNDPLTIQLIKGSAEWAQMIQAELRPHLPEMEPQKGPTDQLKLAFWFIGKIGSGEQAVRVVNAAVIATKELEK